MSDASQIERPLNGDIVAPASTGSTLRRAGRVPRHGRAAQAPVPTPVPTPRPRCPRPAAEINAALWREQGIIGQQPEHRRRQGLVVLGRDQQAERSAYPRGVATPNIS